MNHEALFVRTVKRCSEVLIWGQRGIYILEGPATLPGNGGESAGCIHLGAPNAEQFFNWITGRTRITIDYPW